MDTAFRHIAVCVDDSDASRRALAEAPPPAARSARGG